MNNLNNFPIWDIYLQHFNPDKIILFGSYAAGNPNKDSDLDILYLLDLLAQRIEIDEDIYDKAI